MAVIHRHVLADLQPSAWITVGRAVAATAKGTGLILLYCLRFALAAPETARGLCRIVLDAAPLPALPRQSAPEAVEPARTKKAVLLALYRAHPDYGNRGRASRVAAELAPQAGLQAGTARSYPVRRAGRRESMTPASPAEPTPRALGESLSALAAQIADLRGQIRTISGRLDRAGLSAGVNLAARFEELAQTVAGPLEAAAPRGPAARTGSAWTAAPTPPGWPTCGIGTTPCSASTTAVMSSGTAGPATSTPSGSCPPWPPNSTTHTAETTPISPGPGVLRPGGYPAPCAASPTSPAPACRNARCSAAPATGLLAPGTPTRLGVWGDVAAPAVHGDDLAALAQQRDSTPYRNACNAVLNGQVGFAGQPGVRSESSGIDVSFNVGGNLDGYRRGRVMPYPPGSVLQRHDTHAREPMTCSDA